MIEMVLLAKASGFFGPYLVLFFEAYHIFSLEKKLYFPCFAELCDKQKLLKTACNYFIFVSFI